MEPVLIKIIWGMALAPKKHVFQGMPGKRQANVNQQSEHHSGMFRLCGLCGENLVEARYPQIPQN